jgi:hypothetical protein
VAVCGSSGGGVNANRNVVGAFVPAGSEHLEFRAELFKLSNTPGSSNFGTITTAQGPARSNLDYNSMFNRVEEFERTAAIPFELSLLGWPARVFSYRSARRRDCAG